MRSTRAILVLGFLTASAVSLLIAESFQAQVPSPLGSEFQVNSYTSNRQTRQAIAVDAQGNFVVTWQSEGSYGSDTSSWSIQAQRFDANGEPIGGQFQVNSYTTSKQAYSSVAADPQGNFVVVWVGNLVGAYEVDGNIQAQRFDASGAPVGGEFQVHSYTTTQENSFPSVAAESQGNFVVVWTSEGSYGSDSSLTSIQGQRFDSDGIPIGGQFQVNSYTTYWQLYPSVAADPQGSFVVVWRSSGSYGTDSDGYTISIQGQRFDSSGTSVGGQFQVNSYTSYHQIDPSVATDTDGNFVVVWKSEGSYGSDTSFGSIQAQRFDASGAPVGGEFQVNSYTTLGQDRPSVAVDPRGNFVVVWHSDGSYGTDSSTGSIQAQIFDASGAPVGGEFQVNSYTTSRQDFSSVAADPQGNFVVVWYSDGSHGTDTSESSIQGQRYALPFFADGFESGSTSAWSSTVQ